MFFRKKSNNLNSENLLSENEPLNNQDKIENDIGSDFLLSSLSDNLKKLIKKARNSGFVLKTMVEKAAELDGLSPEEIDDALVLISEIGVDVKDEYDEGEELSLGDEDISNDIDLDEEDDDNDNDSLYGVSKSKIENNDALKEFLSTHKDDEEYQVIDSRSSDPVRNYLRAMGSIELFSRAGEIAIAKRIEAGRKLMIEGLCDSPMTVKKILGWYNDLVKGEMQLRDIVNLELMYGDAFIDKDFEETIEEEQDVVDDTDDEALEDGDFYEDSSSVSLSVMEDALMPKVVETFENIKKFMPKLKRWKIKNQPLKQKLISRILGKSIQNFILN